MLHESPLLDDIQQKQIKSAIKQAEKETSGEIRLFIESRCNLDAMDRAAYLFGELNMHQTKLRNGVLFYLAIKDKRFAILGDAGIHSKTGNDFWDQIKKVMESEFKNGNFTVGLSTGISMAGDALKKHFPYHQKDINELPDDIVFGK